MKIIRFEVEGLKNSFRIPFYKKYHKTFLAPPKPTIIGMLCNISLKNEKEFFDILNKDKVDVSVVINSFESKNKDLWTYKTYIKRNNGKNVVIREFLYLPKYTIYLKIDNKTLYEEFLNNLKEPKNVPSLGLDDELVLIKNVKEINVKENSDKKINSIFIDRGYNYKVYIKDCNKRVEIPIVNSVPVKFTAFQKDKRVSKEVIEEQKQVDFFNCEIKFDEKDNVKSFIDEELNNGLLFY
jgi:CRISPR-associated protein Cas5 subtype I-B